MSHDRRPQRSRHSVEQREQATQEGNARDPGGSLISVREAEDDGRKHRRDPERSAQRSVQVCDQETAEDHFLADTTRKRPVGLTVATRR